MHVKVDVIVQHVLHLLVPNTSTSHSVRYSDGPVTCTITFLPLAFGAQLISAQLPAGTAPPYVPHRLELPGDATAGFASSTLTAKSCSRSAKMRNVRMLEML